MRNEGHAYSSKTLGFQKMQYPISKPVCFQFFYAAFFKATNSHTLSPPPVGAAGGTSPPPPVFAVLWSRWGALGGTIYGLMEMREALVDFAFLELKALAGGPPGGIVGVEVPEQEVGMSSSPR